MEGRQVRIVNLTLIDWFQHNYGKGQQGEDGKFVSPPKKSLNIMFTGKKQRKEYLVPNLCLSGLGNVLMVSF